MSERPPTYDSPLAEYLDVLTVQGMADAVIGDIDSVQYAHINTRDGEVAFSLPDWLNALGLSEADADGYFILRSSLHETTTCSSYETYDEAWLAFTGLEAALRQRGDAS